MGWTAVCMRGATSQRQHCLLSGTVTTKQNLQNGHLSEWNSVVTMAMLFSVHERCTRMWDVPATASGHHQAAVHVWPKQQTRQTGGPAAGLHGEAIFLDYTCTHVDLLGWTELCRWHSEKGGHAKKARAEYSSTMTMRRGGEAGTGCWMDCWSEGV